LPRKDGAGKRCHGLNRGTDHITRNEAELLCAELTKRSDIMKNEIASAMEKVHYAIIVMHIASQRRRLCGADCLGNGGSAVRNRCYGNCLAKTAALLTQKIPFSFIKKLHS
jgi:hypothetical protein